MLEHFAGPLEKPGFGCHFAGADAGRLRVLGLRPRDVRVRVRVPNGMAPRL